MDFYTTLLADLPDPAAVWLEAAAHPTAAADYAAARFQGLYEQARGLLAALAAAPVERINPSQIVDE